ncbi:hypothetical protein Ptc2401_00103 [Prosthecochloris sp. CIB 2401]|nr:hypothetical protein Ptc2401_00103 [Prosthecochloris sp. CIB 2401]
MSISELLSPIFVIKPNHKQICEQKVHSGIESGVQVKAQVEAQVERRIMQACAERPLSSAEIAEALGHKSLSGNVRKALSGLREAGLLEYTIPDKPKSRLQKYRLTEKGRNALEDGV